MPYIVDTLNIGIMSEPRIQELFSNERKAKLMDVHLHNRGDGEVMHGPYDGEAWKEIERK
jgi:hypothetical protein